MAARLAFHRYLSSDQNCACRGGRAPRGRAQLHPANRASRRGRKPQSVAAVLMAFISVTSQMIALAASAGAVPSSSRPTPTAVMASALLRGFMPSPAPAAGYKLIEHIEVPTGAAQCPNSGDGA